MFERLSTTYTRKPCTRHEPPGVPSDWAKAGGALRTLREHHLSIPWVYLANRNSPRVLATSSEQNFPKRPLAVPTRFGHRKGHVPLLSWQFPCFELTQVPARDVAKHNGSRKSAGGSAR